MMHAGAKVHTLRQLELAGADGEDLPDGVQHLADDGRAQVGAEIAHAVVFPLAADDHLREGLAEVDGQVRVLLVVLEQDVVVGAVELDEVALQHQRLDFAVHQHRVQIVDLLHHRPNLRRVVLRTLEVLAHAVFEVLGLAHVDDRPTGLHQVAARRVRQVFQLDPERIVHAHASLP